MGLNNFKCQFENPQRFGTTETDGKACKPIDTTMNR